MGSALFLSILLEETMLKWGLKFVGAVCFLGAAISLSLMCASVYMGTTLPDSSRILFAVALGAGLIFFTASRCIELLETIVARLESKAPA